MKRFAPASVPCVDPGGGAVLPRRRRPPHPGRGDHRDPRLPAVDRLRRPPGPDQRPAERGHAEDLGLGRRSPPSRTLVAGVYGMNFDNMPELHWHYGYFTRSALMLVRQLVGALPVFFKQLRLALSRSTRLRSASSTPVAEQRRAAATPSADAVGHEPRDRVAGDEPQQPGDRRVGHHEADHGADHRRARRRSSPPSASLSSKSPAASSAGIDRKKRQPGRGHPVEARAAGRPRSSRRSGRRRGSARCTAPAPTTTASRSVSLLLAARPGWPRRSANTITALHSDQRDRRPPTASAAAPVIRSLSERSRRSRSGWSRR